LEIASFKSIDFLSRKTGLQTISFLPGLRPGKKAIPWSPVFLLKKSILLKLELRLAAADDEKGMQSGETLQNP
jgi:hypothetical protein